MFRQTTVDPRTIATYHCADALYVLRTEEGAEHEGSELLKNDRVGRLVSLEHLKQYMYTTLLACTCSIAGRPKTHSVGTYF